MSMFKLLLPSEATVGEMLQCAPLTEVLPEELAEVAHSPESRKTEFLSGRACARQALQKLGAPLGPILRDSLGKPVWPEGVIGSITHCPGYRAAVAAWSTDLHSIGIDAELNEPLPQGTLRMVASTEEQEMLAELNAWSNLVAWDRLIFSAKESYYKALTPSTNTRFLPSDFRVKISLEGGFFTAWQISRSESTATVGRWQSRAGFLFSACYQFPSGRPASELYQKLT